MQLAPNRSASLVRKEKALTVTVTGPTYFQVASQQRIGQLRATLQESDAAIGNELGWTDLRRVTVGGSLGGEGAGTWTAGLTLPVLPTPGRFRVLLEQFEVLPTDGGTTKPLTQERMACRTSFRCEHSLQPIRMGRLCPETCLPLLTCTNARYRPGRRECARRG